MSRLRLPPVSPRVVASLAIASLAPAAAEAQQPSFGPLTYEEGSPLQRVAYTPTTEGAEVVPTGVWSVELYSGYSNIFEQDSTATHVLFLDMERLTNALTVRWGAFDGVELGGRVTLETTGGGALDDLVLDWHRAWGFGNANRERFPADAYRQWLTDGDGDVYLDTPARTLALRDVRGFGKWSVWRSTDRRSLLSLRSVVRVPTLAPLEGNDHVDGALAALWRAGVGAWYVHGLLGISLSRASKRLAPVLRGQSRFVTLALERSLGSHVAALAQFQMQSAALRSFDHRELDRAPTNVLLGLAGRIGNSWSWDASFQEDVPADTPAVDFTLALRIARRW